MGLPQGENRLHVQRIIPQWFESHGRVLAKEALPQIVDNPEDIKLIRKDKIAPVPNLSGELQQRVVTGYDNLID